MLVAVVLLIGAVAGIAGTVGSGNSPDYSSGNVAADNTPDSDLATIELGSRPGADNSTLIQIGSMLDTLGAVCTANTRLKIADMTASVITTLDSDGVKLKPTQVLEDATTASDAYAAGGSGEVDCLNLFAALIPLYRSGAT